MLADIRLKSQNELLLSERFCSITSIKSLVLGQHGWADMKLRASASADISNAIIATICVGLLPIVSA